MKRIFHLFIFLFFPFVVFGQSEFSARLSISGAVSQLGISPNEEVWVATQAGNIYYTKQVGDLWHLGPFGSIDPYNSSIGNTFERINFFSKDTAMISGFIQDDGKENFVYWSGDHCKTWQKIIFGKSSWLDAAYINNNGKAWMSGSSQLIYYTADKGKTWKTFDKIEATGNLRFTTVFFSKNETTGLFGSTWNVIYKTDDNCKSWKKIPTPLSQKKYLSISKADRPEIEKIRIFGNHYIVNQQGKAFITKSDSVNWTYLPDVIDFEVTENDELYTINNDLSISHYNSDFIKTWQSEKKLETAPMAIGVRNNKLFALTSEYIYKVNIKEFSSSPLLTNDFELAAPETRLIFGNREFGFNNRDVVCFDKNKNKWFRFMTLDFPIASATIFQNKLLVLNASTNKFFSINYFSKSVDSFALPANFISDKTVTDIMIENGSKGCFSASDSRRIYYKNGNKFVLNTQSSSPGFLSGAMQEINGDIIQKVVDIIEYSTSSKISVADLNISSQDIKDFKTFIDKQEQKIKKSGIDRFDFQNLYAFPGENTDFNFYWSMADSLPNISQDNINNAFWQSYGNWSTTTNWRQVIFTFSDGKKLVVQNADDKPNYLYTPWHVNYDGLEFITNSIQIGQFIDTITNKQFFEKGTNDKNYAIFKITDYLYRKKLKENHVVN